MKSATVKSLISCFTVALTYFGTLPEISFTSTRISMFSPAATLWSCAGVSPALTTAAVSDTPAVYSCSSQTTVTVTVPFPSSRAVLVSAISCTFPVGTASSDASTLSPAVISDLFKASPMSGCPDISGLSAGLFSGYFPVCFPADSPVYSPVPASLSSVQSHNHYRWYPYHRHIHDYAFLPMQHIGCILSNVRLHRMRNPH